MGRILVQMVGSRQLGLGTDLLLFIMLIFAALKGGWCVSCQPNFLLLGVSVQFSVLLGLGSVLVHPKSNSTDEDILLQVSGHKSWFTAWCFCRSVGSPSVMIQHQAGNPKAQP